MSHRALGPLGRLEEEIKNMVASDDNLKEIKIREGDELESVVQSINDLIRKAKGQH